MVELLVALCFSIWHPFSPDAGCMVKLSDLLDALALFAENSNVLISVIDDLPMHVVVLRLDSHRHLLVLVA